MVLRVFLFGEAEKGEYCTPIRLDSVVSLAERLGNPPQGSLGIEYAIQSLLFKRELIFYRVQEEGFSHEDYLRGIKLLHNQGFPLRPSAICIPGVGDREVIESLTPICKKLRALLILSERDLYDYLTGSK